MVALIITLLLQSLAVAPRTAMENPALTSPVPRKLQKDYDKLWQRFTKGKEDNKVMQDADKLLRKNPQVISLIILEGYLDLVAERSKPAEAKFQQVLNAMPVNRIALSYLAEFAFARQEYGRAYELYSRLLEADPSRTDIETKRQKALLLTTQDLIINASAAEQANRFGEAESLYSQALRLAPREPSLHQRLGELYAKEMKWAQALEEFRKAQESGAPSDETDRHIAEALANLGRAEEARQILDRLKRAGSGDQALEATLNELDDIGRWGSSISIFRAIQASPTLTRAQLAVLLLRYFPQLAESRKIQIITDAPDSPFFPEIQTVVGAGLLDLRPNRTFQPAANVTRGELASALARLVARLGISPATAPPVPLSDVAPTNARYRDLQVTLSYALMAVDDGGNFNTNGVVSGDDAIATMKRVLLLSRGKLR